MGRARGFEPVLSPPSVDERWGMLARLGLMLGLFVAYAALSVGLVHYGLLPDGAMTGYYVATAVFAVVFALAGPRRPVKNGPRRLVVGTGLVVATIFGTGAGVLFGLPAAADHGASVTEQIGDVGQAGVGYVKDAVHDFRDGGAK